MRISGRILALYTVVLLQGVNAAADVIINEIHYNPDVKTEPAEFVELYNSGPAAVNVGGWSLDSGLHYTIPPGTNMPPNTYLVIAANPPVILAKYGAKAIGPFSGGLSKWGDKVTLRNASSNVVDEVEYGMGFPWPIVGEPPGYSIELINPSLDNSLGGSWRASVLGGASTGSNLLINAGSIWKYKKGTAEPSSPSTEWRQPGYDDSAWPSGVAPVGYDSSLGMGTSLSDMNGAYSTFYVRRTFVINDPDSISSLRLEALYDDGFKLWINGSNVINAAMPPGEVAYNGLATGSARESASYDPFVINNPRAFLVPGTNVIALQVANVLLSGSSDAYIDVRLSSFTGTPGSGPTPGARNSVYATNAPPQIRQVAHSPEQPKAGQPVTITAKVTDPDGVGAVVLQYQLVHPGNYIELTDAAYATNWISVPMTDSGLNGDAAGGDDTYTAVLPGELQVHRRLIRYRITVTDSGGRLVRVPYADDPQPNFAYFCYNGVPAWSGQVQPPSAPVISVSSNEMNRLPVFHLIAKSNSVLTATGWNPGAPNNKYGGDDYLWKGALVYDGKVYDHIGYRMRGGVWRYAMGKNAWKFALNRGHDLEVRDDYGKKYNSRWRRLSFRADIQQGDFLHRGEQGMFESVGYKLFRMAGVTAPKTTHIQFRIIDEPDEAPVNNQYVGDFYGLYLVVEEQDGRLLEERGLPDGNIYDMEAGTGALNHTGPAGPTDKSDLNYFLNTYNGTSPADSWWRTNLNLQSYYGYQAIVQGIHHYDIADGKNYFYYRNPVTGLWEVWPWDLDLTWADNMYRSGTAGGDEPFKSRVLSNFSTSPSRPALTMEFKNRLREIRDLLFNNDQGFKVIDEMAALIHGPETFSIIDADRCQWDYNPIMFNSAIVNLSKAGNYHFYQWQNEPGTSNNFFGAAQLMKNYMNYRISSANLGIGNSGLDGLAADPLIPGRPLLNYTGPASFAINRLTFHSSSYVGQNSFASMKWRAGEILDAASPLYKPGDPWIYEIDPVWESGPLTTFAPDIAVPAAALRPGHRYRVRAQFTDATGRTSNWSLPVEFVCGEGDNAGDLLNYLRITELMYNPPAGGYEYIELHNTSSSMTLDLQGVTFTAGISYTFPLGANIPPGGYLLLANTADFAGFRAFYGLAPSVPVVGPFASGSLNNAGETVTLKTSVGGLTIVSFTYSDARGWPLAADGGGHSLVLVDTAVSTQSAGSGEYGANWRASSFIKGSPGQADPTPSASVWLNEITANTNPEGGFEGNDWIELFNPADNDITLGPDWYLSDDDLNLKKWQLPPTTLIPARGFVSFDEITGFHNPTNTGFALDKFGAQVFLSYLPGTSQDRVADTVRFKAQENSWSWGRYPDGGPFWAALSPLTRNGTNAPPAPRLVINEILYHPPDIGGTNDNSLDEFVEIYNPTASAVALSNTDGPWRMDGTVSFTFPSGQSLGAGGYLLLVNFNPTNTAQLETFKSLYAITNSSVEILGPYLGKLANSSDRVAIEKPQATGNALQPLAWVIVDEVFYADQPPWPCGTDGTGASLQRQNTAWHGSDPAIWGASAPTAGRSNAAQLPGAPTIIVQPLGRVVPMGSLVTFSVAACGNPPFTYQWRLNGTNLPAQTNATLTLTNLASSQSGDYRVLVSNTYGAELSAVAELVVQSLPEIVSHPQSQTILVSNSVTFSVAASGSPPLSYQWQFNGTNLAGATNQTLLLTNVQTSQAGNYSALVVNTAGSAVSSNAALNVLVPVYLLNPLPSATNLLAGGTLTLNVNATGTGPLSYQWYFQDEALPGRTSATLVLTNLQMSNAGPYRVSVSNAFSGLWSSPVEVAVVQVPVFTEQPVSQSALVGSSVTFTAAVTGTLPMGVRWLKGSTSLTAYSNVTSGIVTLTIPNVQLSDAGGYRAVVTNAARPLGTASATATLTVLSPPVVTAHPTNRTINAASNASFSVTVAGTAPFSYQWQFNNADMSGATNSILSITNAQPGQEGEYRVIVTNGYGSVPSQPALLTVLFAPVLSEPAIVPNNGFRMYLRGNRNYTYTLERSGDLSNWTSWGSVTYTNGPMPVVDSAGTNGPRRFYRVRRNP